MHNDTHSPTEPHYWVMATLSEPKYATERKFLDAERAFVERTLAGRRRLKNVSVPSLGIYGHKDWQHYARELEKYAHKLDRYEDEVESGVLPVKFWVYNNAAQSDRTIKVHIKVSDGRVDEAKKAPERPKRLDERGKPWKFTFLGITGFSRKHIKITAHAVGAELSELGPHDGAVLVNQVVHIHCGPDTQVVYELASRSVAHETGEVEISD